MFLWGFVLLSWSPVIKWTRLGRIREGSKYWTLWLAMVREWIVVDLGPWPICAAAFLRASGRDTPHTTTYNMLSTVSWAFWLMI